MSAFSNLSAASRGHGGGVGAAAGAAGAVVPLSESVADQPVYTQVRAAARGCQQVPAMFS